MTSLRCTKVIGGKLTSKILSLNSICANPFPYKMPIREERLLQNIKSGSLSGYVHCDFEVPKKLREVFVNFPLILENIDFGKDDIGPFIEKNAEKKGLLTQSRRTLISSCFLENGTFISPLLLFYLDRGLVCKKLYRSVQFIPMKCSNKFVQSAVNAGRENMTIPNPVLWQKQ